MSGANSIDLDHLWYHDEHHLADQVVSLFTQWDSARQVAKDRWKETLQFKYATSTRETVNGHIGGFDSDGTDEGMAGWSHSTHIPKIAEIADNLAANYMSTVYPHENFFKFIGEDDASINKAVRNKIEAYLVAKHRAYKLRDVVQQLINDYVDYGNCFASVELVKEITMPEEYGQSVKRGYSGPIVRRISPNDIVFNPLATSFRDSPIILRSVKTMGELIRDAEENYTLGYSAEAVKKGRELRTTLRTIGTKEFDKHIQMMYDGFGSASQYLQSGYVEILELFGDLYDVETDTFYKNHVITVMDRRFILRKQALDTVDGRPLIFHAGWRKRQDNLWAMGPLDNLIGMQFLINHLENARADAFDQMLAPTRVEIGDVERIDVVPGKPGGTYRVSTAEGDVRNLLPDTTVLTADNQIMLKMEQMEQFAGLPKQELGIRTPGEKTFGEVMHLSRSASKVFKNKIMTFENFLSDLINAELELVKQLRDVEDLISVVGETGAVAFLNITAEDLKANGKMVPVGAQYFERQQQLVQNLQLFQQLLSQDPLASQHFSSVGIAKLYAELMDIDKLNIIFPYVRVGEQAELMKLQQAAQIQVQEDDMVDLTTDVNPDEGLEDEVAPG